MLLTRFPNGSIPRRNHTRTPMARHAGVPRQRQRPWTPAFPDNDNDNLLGEILLRVGFPTTLVCAALVCRCWYQLGSDQGFLCRFRELHPPRLLGFYVDSFLVRLESIAVPRFVPMLPQPPELATVVCRMANHNFNDFKVPWIMDSRNGSIFTRHRERRELAYGVHRPLCPERGIDVVPPLPSAQDRNRQNFGAILSKEEGNGLSYFYVLTEVTDETKIHYACVYVARQCLVLAYLGHIPAPSSAT